MWAKMMLVWAVVMGLWGTSLPVPVPYSAGIAVSPEARSPIIPPAVIRFRVIANSDNPVDQAVKLDVRDALLQRLDPLLSQAKSRQKAAALIHTHLHGLTMEADKVLAAHDMDYSAHVELTRTQFPTKVYGSWVLPAGTYQALLVVLGRGQGHNWWCVLFPSLCFIDMSNAVAIPARDAVKASTSVAPAAPANPVAIPAVPVHVPAQVVHSADGTLHVSWKLPNAVNHLLEWF